MAKKKDFWDQHVDVSDQSDGFVVLNERKTLNRQIDEAVYNIQKEDYNEDGVLDSDREISARPSLRRSSVDGF
jgi:hypothetical protein